MKKNEKSKANIVDTFNVRERAVVRFLAVAARQDAVRIIPPKGERALHDIATRCFDRKVGASVKASSAFRANSWARNAVRRPLRERVIVRVGKPGSGEYRITAKGARLAAEAKWAK